MLSIVLVVGTLLAIVVGHAVLAEGQVRLTASQAALTAAQATERQQTLSVARLETPSRIVGEATGSLAMVQSAQTIQLPHVPLDKPLATPRVGPAAQPTGPATAAGAHAATPGT